MTKLFSFLSVLSFLLLFFEVAKASEYKFFKTSANIIDNIPTLKFYGVSSSGTETLLNTWESTTSNVDGFGVLSNDTLVDQYEGKIYYTVHEQINNDGDYTHEHHVIEYDLVDNTAEKIENISLEDVQIYPEGIVSMISKDNSTGVLRVGENSLKLKETSNAQLMWATDSKGHIAPINITNGSKLLINGRDVEQSINNIGALSAALTGLPTLPIETTLVCGLGTGTHGGDFAFSGGCASKVNEKLSLNYAASTTMPGQDYAGDFIDTFSARAGFVWKLGKAIEPNQISMKDKKNFKTKIKSLEEKNNQLTARLDRLEKLLKVKANHKI